MNFTISLQCPQCGGPVELAETDRLFGCPYCRSRLHITANGAFRYWIPPKNTVTEDLIFIPYWRFKGFSLTVKKGETSVRLIDTTYPGTLLKGFPLSLGIRTQALSLKYITTDIPCFLLEPSPFKDILPTIQQRLDEADRLSPKGISTGPLDVISHTYIGETRSVVYQPFYLKGDVIYDAVTDTPLAGGVKFENVRVKRPADWGLRFIPAQCPQCGWDLEGERDSLVLFCRNCNSAWSSSGGNLQRQPYHIADTDSTNCSVYLPFWKIRTLLSPIELENYIDLIKFANLPKVPLKKWEQRPFYFWIPAFKIQPEKFLNISKVATLSQMDTVDSDKLPEGRIFTTTLPSHEAIEIITALLFEISRPRKRMIDLYKELSIQVIETDYVLVPFQETPYLFRQPQTGIGISKGLLRYGRYI